MISYVSFKSSLTSEILQHLDSVASIQKSRIEAIIEQNLERLLLISSRTQLRITLNRFHHEADQDALQKMTIILRDAQKSIPSFEEISIIDPKGIVLVSTDEGFIGKNFVSRSFFIKGQIENKADYFFLDDEKNLKTYFSGPLQLNGVFLGVLLVSSNVDNLISAIQDYSGLGKTGETVLGKVDEAGEVIFLAPLRFNPGAALQKLPLTAAVFTPMLQALNRKERLIDDAIDYRGAPVLAAIKYSDSLKWGLVVKLDQSEAYAPIDTLRNELFGLMFIFLVAVIFIASYFAKHIVSPISKITDRARAITDQFLSEKTIDIEQNEVKSLEHSFEQMTQGLLKANQKLKDTQAQLIQSEKLASLGELSTGVAHELNQPLQIIKMCVDLGQIHLEREDLDKAGSHLQQINTQVDRAAEIIQHLKIFGRDASLQKREKVSPNQIVHSSLIMLRGQLEHQGILLELALSGDLPLFEVNPLEIEQVLVNLITNARDALESSQEKKIIIRTARKYQYIIFEVEDSGSGILTAVREKVFDPFFTTKPVGKGTGLGLSICYGILKDHQGTISVRSEYGKGAVFTLSLPIDSEEEA